MLLDKHQLAKIHTVYLILSTELNRRISIAELCKSYGLSRAALTLGFKQKYGCTVSHYHLQQRMIYAKSLMEAGFQAQEVADKLGYSEASAFTHAFKRIFPNSPIRYRSAE